MAQSTLTSILKKGVVNSTVDKVHLIAKALNVTVKELAEFSSNKQVETQKK